MSMGTCHADLGILSAIAWLTTTAANRCFTRTSSRITGRRRLCLKHLRLRGLPKDVPSNVELFVRFCTLTHISRNGRMPLPTQAGAVFSL